MIFVSVKVSASYLSLYSFLSDQDPAKLNPKAFLNFQGKILGEKTRLIETLFNFVSGLSAKMSISGSEVLWSKPAVCC